MKVVSKTGAYKLPVASTNVVVLSHDEDLPDNTSIVFYLKETEFGQLTNIQYSMNGGTNWHSINTKKVSRRGSRYIVREDHTGIVSFRVRVTAVDGAVLKGLELLVSDIVMAPLGPTPPSPPLSLNATTQSDTEIDIAWSVPTLDGGSPITGYRIERREGAGSFITIVASQPGLTYSDTLLTPATLYTYRVYAINTIGESLASNTASDTTTGGASIPGQVTNENATAVSDTQIDVTWDVPSDGGSPITGYLIERQVGGAGGFSTLVASHPTNSYSDTGLTASTLYEYRISAINIIGTGPVSGIASDTTNSGVFSPIDLTTLHAWYDPTDLSSITETGGLVDQLNDKSGNNQHLTATGADRPTTGVNTLNGNNVLDFNGSNRMVAPLTGLQAQPLNYFAVIKIDDNSVGAMNFYDGDDGTNRISLFKDGSGTPQYGYLAPTVRATTTNTDANWHYYRNLFDSITSLFFIDGVDSTPGSPSGGIGGVDGVTLGSRHDGLQALNGKIAELVICGTMTAQEVTDMNTYLTTKYGL